MGPFKKTHEFNEEYSWEQGEEKQLSMFNDNSQMRNEGEAMELTEKVKLCQDYLVDCC